MGEPKVKNVCYQVEKKNRYRDEVQRKVKGLGVGVGMDQMGSRFDFSAFR